MVYKRLIEPSQEYVNELDKLAKKYMEEAEEGEDIEEYCLKHGSSKFVAELKEQWRLRDKEFTEGANAQ